MTEDQKREILKALDEAVALLESEPSRPRASVGEAISIGGERYLLMLVKLRGDTVRAVDLEFEEPSP